MMALWMLYAVVVAVLLAGAAAVLERVLRLRGRPGRWVWAAALGGSWLLPLATWLRPPRAAATAEPGAGAAMGGIDPALLASLVQGAEVAASGPPAWLAPMGVALGLGWAVLAVAAVILFVLAVRSVARRSRAWPTRRIRGEPVRISPDFGPAVVGLRDPEIVLPEWTFELERTAQELVIMHEAEHRNARDTLLLAAGTVATLAAPWNPALWWQLRRLRLAVELDCDARVLESGVSPRCYGDLLLNVGERMGGSVVPVAALAEPRSFLERRLRTMTEGAAKGAVWKVGAGLVAAGLMVVAACEAPAPPAGEVEVTVEMGEEGAIVLQERAERSSRAAAERAALELEAEAALAAAEQEAVAARAREVVESRSGTITLRGTQSIQASGRTPLVYVDGVRMENRPAGADVRRTLPSGLEPDDIDRIEVIKGGAARALYGEEAAGGVIQIFTKKDEGATARFEFRERPAGVIREVRVTGVEDEGDDERGISGRVLDVARKGLVRALGLIVKPLPFLAEASGSPLIVVDEEEWSQSRLETLDRELIDRVEVIKGDAARERWGERGANGVVRIFLKN